jgi:O-antigen/teichoic acid export membrane protein
LHTLSFAIIGQVTQVVAGVVYARILGPAGKGILSYAVTIVVLSMTIADGIRQAIAYEIGTEHENQRRVFGTALEALTLIAFAGVFVWLGLMRIGPHPEVYPVVGVAFTTSLFLNGFIGLYLVHNLVERTNAVYLAATILMSLGGAVGVWLFKMSPLGIVAVMAFANLLAAGFLLRGAIVLAGGAPIFRSPGLLGRHLRFAGTVALASTITYLALRVDVFLVSARLPAASLGLYTLALGSGELMWQLGRAAGTAAFGRIATLPREESIALTARLTRSVILVQSVVAIALFVVGPWLITRVYGSAFTESGAVMRIALPGLVVYSATSILAQFFSLKEGRPRIAVAVELFSLTLCVVVTMITVGRFGIAGAAAAKTLAYFTSFAVASAIFVRRTGVSVFDVLIPRREDLDGLVQLVRARLPSRGL